MNERTEPSGHVSLLQPCFTSPWNVLMAAAVLMASATAAQWVSAEKQSSDYHMWL